MNNKEIWKDIPNYEGLYQISDTGRIKSLKRNIILKPSTNKNYFKIILCKNGSKKTYFIHRLVAIAFISNPKNLLEVNHIDGNKLNNNVNNLEWCTRKENVEHSIRNGLVIKNKGLLLTKDELYKKYIIEKKSVAQIVKDYNYKYSISTINRALKRNNIKIRSYKESAENKTNYLKSKLDKINFKEEIKNKTIKEVAEGLNINCDYLYHYLNNKNIYKLHPYNRKEKVNEY